MGTTLTNPLEASTPLTFLEFVGASDLPFVDLVPTEFLDLPKNKQNNCKFTVLSDFFRIGVVKSYLECTLLLQLAVGRDYTELRMLELHLFWPNFVQQRKLIGL